MTALTGVFAELPGIEFITPENIQKHLQTRYNLTMLENFLANRMLYPQTVATTKEDKLVDFAIIKEYITRNPGYFYNPLSHRLVIPLDIIHRIQPRSELMIMLCSLIPLSTVVPVFVNQGASLTSEGTIITSLEFGNYKKIKITINSYEQEIEIGKIYQFPSPSQHMKIKIANTAELMVSGGQLGITIYLKGKI